MKREEWTALILIATLIFAPLYCGEAQYFIHANGQNSSSKTPNPTEILAWLGFGVLVSQAWISHRQREWMARQADIMSGQLELSKNTAISQLRAYVCVVGANVILDPRDFPRHVIFEFKNSGQTPAYNARIWVTIWLEKHPLTVELPRQKEDFLGGTSIIAPGASTALQSADVPPQTLEIRAKFGTTDCTLYAYGRVAYIDAFGERRYTDFRLIYGGQDGITSRGRMQPDSSGNEAT